MDTILAVDTDVKVHNEQTEEWSKYSVDTIRVDTMGEAIARLTRGEVFLFIAINEDTIQDFMTYLPILRDVTDLPIFVITSSYTNEKKRKALSLGADAYDPFNNYAKDNVLGAIVNIKAQNRWANRKKVLPLFVGGEIMMSLPRRKVFIRNIEIELTKTDFDILHYFITNEDIVLTYAQIYGEIWGYGYDDEAGHALVWNHIHSLREKLEKASGSKNYIKTERDIGYRFSIPKTDS